MDRKRDMAQFTEPAGTQKDYDTSTQLNNDNEVAVYGHRMPGPWRAEQRSECERIVCDTTNSTASIHEILPPGLGGSESVLRSTSVVERSFDCFTSHLRSTLTP